jgi:hypothetical protein
LNVGHKEKMEVTESSQKSIIRHIEAIIPKEKIIQVVREFLHSCDWQLEIDEEMIPIPQDAEIRVRSRAFIKADIEDAIFLGDHYEAAALIGIDEGFHAPKYGILKLYFNLKGEFVSEDRYKR